MYLDPYEIAHVFCGNFSLFCFFGMGWEGGYSKRSCPLVWVALIPARSILYNVKKQLWCLIFSTRLHALRVRSFSFWSLFVFLCRSGSQRHCCCTTRGASSMTSSTSQSKEEAHGALGPPRCREKNDDVIIKQCWRKHGRATFASYWNYLDSNGKTHVRFCRWWQNFQMMKSV